MRLGFFVGPDSWYIFSLLEVPTDNKIFHAPARRWKELEEYIQLKNALSQLAFTNDAVKRGIKLAEEKIGCSKKENLYQNIVQVMERDKKESPKIRKSHSK